VSGDYKYKKEYEKMNKRILDVDLNSIQPKAFPKSVCGEEVKKILKKAFREIGLDISVTGLYHYYGRINIDYPPRFNSKNDYGTALRYGGCVSMPHDVRVKLVQIIMAIFPDLKQRIKDQKYSSLRMESYFEINGDAYFSFDKKYAKSFLPESSWKKTKITKTREKVARRKPIVCDNKKCEHWVENKKKGNCKLYTGKGRRTCKRRLNPDNKPCSICGREQTDKIVIRETIIGMVCQYCRASDIKHINLVKRLGGIPKYKNKTLLEKEDYYKEEGK
jgi:hypothetical protein